MASVVGTFAFTAASPKDRLLRAVASMDYNSAQWAGLTITVPNNYRQLKLLTMRVQGAGIATMPAFADGENALMLHRRAGEPLSEVQSEPRSFGGITAATPTTTYWWWEPDHLKELFPNAIPGDTYTIDVPPIDDSGSPTGDFVVVGIFYIIKF